MTRFLTTAAAATCVIAIMAAPRQAMTLTMDSGSQIIYYLDQQPSIIFDSNRMLVATTAGTDVLPIEDVVSWHVGIVDDASKSDASLSSPRLSIDSHRLTVTCPIEQMVAVYSLNGRMVARAEGLTVGFELSQGIYLVTVANNTYKIAIQ